MGKTYLDWLKSLSKEAMAEYLCKHFDCSSCPASSRDCKCEQKRRKKH